MTINLTIQKKFSEHPHAASAFFPSPFEEAVVLTADGVGEWATTTISIDVVIILKLKKRSFFPILWVCCTLLYVLYWF